MTGGLIANTLRESLNRRSGLVLLGSGLMVALLFCVFARFTQEGGRLVVYVGIYRPMPAEQFVSQGLRQLLLVCTAFWIYLTAFAVAALLVTPFERGYLELLLAKPLSRTRLLAGRYLGAMVLAGLGLAALVVPVVLKYRWYTGYPLGRFAGAVALVLLSYAVLAAFLHLITVLQPNTGLVILVGYATMILSAFLERREQIMWLTAFPWAHRAADLAYYLLPKFSEIGKIAENLHLHKEVLSWMPVWSSALFGVACWLLAAFAFSRKSY